MSFIGFSVPGTISPLFCLCLFQIKTSFFLLGQWICQLYCSYTGLNSSSSCSSLLVCGLYLPLCFHFPLPRDRAFFTIPSHSGFHYGVLFYIIFIVIVLMKHKSEVFGHFKAALSKATIRETYMSSFVVLLLLLNSTRLHKEWVLMLFC